MKNTRILEYSIGENQSTRTRDFQCQLFTPNICTIAGFCTEEDNSFSYYLLFQTNGWPEYFTLGFLLGLVTCSVSIRLQVLHNTMSFNRAVPLIPSTKKAQESAQTIVTLCSKRTTLSLFSFSSLKRIDTPGASSSFSRFCTVIRFTKHVGYMRLRTIYFNCGLSNRNKLNWAWQ